MYNLWKTRIKVGFKLILENRISRVIFRVPQGIWNTSMKQIFMIYKFPRE